MKKQLLLLAILLSMFGKDALAYDFAVENAYGVTIYYNYINDATELEVTSGGNNSYTGSVIIPEEVTYMNRTRKVTSIGVGAFFGCEGLTSITIPNSVTSIGDKAFYGCIGLTSITIGNSVTSIGNWAFNSCSSLTSITIPNSVTSIGDWGFVHCTSLTSITIPNSVTSIGEAAFYGLSGLTSISIGNSVTSIGNYAFHGCSGLTSVTIPNSVTSIGNDAFSFCTGLTSVTIPNSVTSIGSHAFAGCTGLTSITIPNSVTSIGNNAFDGWDLPVIISKIENPFKIEGKSSGYNTFNLNTFNNATLYVPVGTIDKYKSTEGWKDFMFIEEGEGGGDTPPESSKCEKPTISYKNGKLTFISATEGATCQYTITDSDIKSGSSNEVDLSVTYNISVYATKSGFENSETATATLCWIDADPKMEGITDDVAQIPSKAMLIQSNGGLLTIQGIEEGINISVYSISGYIIDSTKAKGNQASLTTNLKKGDLAIIKIGEKSVKVVIQ